MWDRNFWAQTGERAVRAFASSLLSVWTIGGATGLLDVHWGAALSVAGGATAVSVLTSIVASGVGQKGTASLVDVKPEQG